MLVRRVDLSHTNLVGTRAGMLVGGVMLIHSMLIKRGDCLYLSGPLDSRFLVE